MLQNLAWATGYKTAAIPAAAGALAWGGITLGPAVAAFLMSASTVIGAERDSRPRQCSGRSRAGGGVVPGGPRQVLQHLPVPGLGHPEDAHHSPRVV